MLPKYFENIDILFQFNSATKHYNNEQRPENVRKTPQNKPSYNSLMQQAGTCNKSMSFNARKLNIVRVLLQNRS